MVKTILMVDDEPDQLYMVKTSFHEHFEGEYNIVTVSSGKECINYLEKNENPDLILLDIMMPGMNGWEVQRTLKEHPKWRDIPIVFLTARDDSFSIKIGSTVSNEYIVKPYSLNDLKTTIDTVVQKPKSKKIILDPIQKDSLQEVVNIGAAHAATSLSKMVHKYIKIGIPNIQAIPLEETMNSLKNSDTSIGIYIQLSPEFPTYCLLLINEEDAYALINLLFEERPLKSDEYLTDMYKSALQEIGNIMLCSFLDSLAELFDITVVPGPPLIAHDQPEAILDYILV